MPTRLDDDGGAAPTAAELVCVTELAAACHAVKADHPELDVRVEAAGDDARRASPRSEDAARRCGSTISRSRRWSTRCAGARLTRSAARPSRSASSQLAVATPDGRPVRRPRRRRAPTPPLWACIGDDAGDAVDRRSAATPSCGRDPPVARRRRPRGGRARRRSPTPSPATSARPAITPARWATTRRSGRGCAAWPAPSTSGAVGRHPAGDDGDPRRRPRHRRHHRRRASQVLFAFATDFSSSTTLNPSMWVEAVLAVPDGTAAPDGLGRRPDRRR